MVRAMTRMTGVVLVVLAACGGSREPSPAPAPAAPASPTPNATTTGGLGAPKIPWKAKTHAQRLEYMGLYVVDRMHTLFAEWKPGEFAGEQAFRCQTCHGENFDKPPVDFHMPRVAFPLSADDPIGAAMKYDPAAATFMVEKVVPTMAELLSEEPYDPASGKGTFGCFRCHPKKGEKVP